jgi:hypothetical protein
MLYVITLVHGTRLFLSGRAKWASAGSPFRRQLEDALRPATCNIHEFLWSGANSMDARKIAAAKLGESLSQLVLDAPDAQHFVIAHSHGGTVSLHSIRDMWLARNIDGVACMSTPFLHVHRNSEADFGKELGTVLRWAAPLCGVVALYRWARSLFIPNKLLFAIWLGFALVTCFIVIFAIVTAVSEKLGRKADEISNANAWPKEIRTSVLFLRGVADEASGALTAMQFSSWLLRQAARIASFPNKLAARIMEYLGSNRTGLTNFVLAGIMGTLSPVLLLLLPAYLFLRTLMAIVTFPLVLVGAVSSVAFGREVPLVAPLLNVSAEWTPPGNWSVTLLSGDGDRRGLQHSVYEDERAAIQIADWIVSTGKPPRPPS